MSASLWSERRLCLSASLGCRQAALQRSRQVVHTEGPTEVHRLPTEVGCWPRFSGALVLTFCAESKCLCFRCVFCNVFVFFRSVENVFLGNRPYFANVPQDGECALIWHFSLKNAWNISVRQVVRLPEASKTNPGVEAGGFLARKHPVWTEVLAARQPLRYIFKQNELWACPCLVRQWHVGSYSSPIDHCQPAFLSLERFQHLGRSGWTNYGKILMTLLALLWFKYLVMEFQSVCKKLCTFYALKKTKFSLSNIFSWNYKTYT